MRLKSKPARRPPCEPGIRRKSYSYTFAVADAENLIYRHALRRKSMRLFSLSFQLTLRSMNTFVTCWMKHDETQCSRWITLIMSGEICGTGIGPPCETWSRARFNVIEDLQGRQPRPLRSLEQLWGFLGVRLKEHRQLDAGNRILCFGLHAALVQAMTGGFSFVEHPLDQRKLPQSPPEAPTIWATTPVRWLDDLQIFYRLELCQGHFGAKSSKPTCFLISGVPPEKARKIETRSRICNLPKKGSIGLCNGQWATTPLKGYIEHLCRMLARLFAEWLAKQKVFPPRDVQMNLSWIHKLCVDLDQKPRRAGPGPDYAGGTECHN